MLHPHPLQGGARENKVVTTIARACVQHGLVAVRPNFRGVGLSEGEFDKSVGETRDMLALVAQVREQHPELAQAPWVLAGFSSAPPSPRRPMRRWPSMAMRRCPRR